MNPVRCLGALVIVAVGATGCVSLDRPVVEKRQYVLEARRSGDAPATPRGGVLDVRTFRASPRSAGTKFVYRTADDVYESDFYRVFWAPPTALVADEVRRWLAASGVFEDVLEPGSAVEPSYLLEGAISDLYGDFRPGETPRAVLGVRVALVDVRNRASRIVLSRDYAAEVALPAADPDLLVEGWNTALRRILEELETDLRATPRR